MPFLTPPKGLTTSGQSSLSILLASEIHTGSMLPLELKRSIEEQARFASAASALNQDALPDFKSTPNRSAPTNLMVKSTAPKGFHL